MELDSIPKFKYEEKDMMQEVSKGIKDLWQQEILTDYCIKCENQEFRAHKVVLAAGSDYFRTMLTSSFKESSENSVELKSVSATGMNKLLKYFYTNAMEINETNVSDILGAAVHLQVQPAIDICCQYLMSNLNFENCFGVREVLQIYQLDTLAEEADYYIYVNANEILESEYICGFSFKEVKELIGTWHGPRWDLISCIDKWISFASEGRYKYLDVLMQKVMISVLPQAQLEKLVQMDIYTKCSSGKWKEEVKDALNYYKLPVWKKATREDLYYDGGPDDQLIVFTTEEAGSVVCGSEFYVLEDSEVLDCEDGSSGDVASWSKIKLPNVKEDICKNGSAAVVNNFLVVAGGYESATPNVPSNKCYIFYVNEMKWTQVGDMITRRLEFPLVECKNRLYALGGCTGDPCNAYSDAGITSDAEMFVFETNTWVPVPGLPRALRHHSACSLDGIIYVSGGLTCSEDRRELRSRRISFEPQPSTISRELHTFDLSTKIWKSKAPMIERRYDHLLFTNYLKGEDEVVMALGRHYPILEYYVPSDDQWTIYNLSLPFDPSGVIPTHGTRVDTGYGMIHFLTCKEMLAGEPAENSEATIGDLTCGILHFDIGIRPDVYVKLTDLHIGPCLHRKIVQYCAHIKLPYDDD